MESPQNDQLWLNSLCKNSRRYHRIVLYVVIFSLIGLVWFLNSNVTRKDSWFLNIDASTTHERSNLGNDFDEEFQTNNRCIDGYMAGSAGNAGMGNVAFELITLIGIANQTKRNPIVSHPNNLKRLIEVAKWFPNLFDYLMKMEAEAKCVPFSKTITMSDKCCTVDENSLQRISDSKEPNIRIEQTYTQGIRYISALQHPKIKELLRGSVKAVRSAKHELFPPNPKRQSTKNICIHTRRSDFVKNPLVFGSEEVFTRSATLYILEKEGQEADIYVLGADAEFNEKTFKGWKNVYVARTSKDLITNTDWEFSRLYCDVVLITQAASTYGWWIGFLSRGQKVYYSKKFSKPGGLERQLTPAHFWPKEWIPLALDKSSDIIEDPWQ